MCAESLGKISVPFNFGTLSTHWYQTFQQMVVINHSAVADSAGADYSLQNNPRARKACLWRLLIEIVSEFRSKL